MTEFRFPVTALLLLTGVFALAACSDDTGALTPAATADASTPDTTVTVDGDQVADLNIPPEDTEVSPPPSDADVSGDVTDPPPDVPLEADGDEPGEDIPTPPEDVPTDEGGPGEDVPTAPCAGFPVSEYCPCEQDDDCASGFCLPTSEGKACAEICESDCPDGYACSLVGTGGDPVYICVERVLNLCRPCATGADCVVPGFEGADQCVSYGDDGSFCGVGCASDLDCPDGYGCDGGQCTADEGCTCAPFHIALGASTSCSVTNASGVCQGVRSCEAGGLTPCSAPVPADELCDGIDNNCNGVVDDLLDTSCELSNQFGSCPGQVICLGGGAVCQGTPPSPEICDGLDNDCNGEADEGYANTDGDPLSDCVDPDDDNDGSPDETDVCPKVADDQMDTDGDGAGDACDPDDDNDGSADSLDCQPLLAIAYPFAPEICDGIDNDCDEVVDELTCDDGDHCTDDICSPTNGCTHPFNTVPCNDGNPCTENDACNLGFCEGTFGACDDENPCTLDQCTKDTGCTHTPLSGPCDDGNACTTGDTCGAGGQCYGQPVFCNDDNGCTTDSCDPTQGCAHLANDDPCDDGSVCTSGDSCVDGACTGTDLVCDDSNACTDDTCDTAFGCTYLPNTNGCSDDDICTVEDVCQGGTCLGAPVDCSPLDGPCQVGVCENGGCVAQEYACQVTRVPVHTPSVILGGTSEGSLRLRGSAGHAGPTGRAEGAGVMRIHFGFAPRF